MIWPDDLPALPAARAVERSQLEAVVEGLASAIDRGTVQPLLPELRALQEVCEASRCPDLALRVRRWRGIA
jgi:hypothetical protein